jgi:hypothetical protein
MMNIQTLGMLLRTLQTGDVSPRALSPLQPLAPTQSVKPVSSEDSQAQKSAAREQGHLPAPARQAPIASGATTGSATPVAPARAETAAVVSLLSNALGETPDAAPLSTARETSAGGSVAAARPGASSSPLPTPTDTAASLRLSTAALAIDQLVRRPGGEPVRPSGTLVPTPDVPDAPEAIAMALQRSIANSGVFYESHLAEWTLQRHSVAYLQQEPQAAWPSAGTSGTAAVLPAALPLEGAAAASAPSMPPTSPTLAPLPDGAPALVRQQLDVLETGQILWRGDLWPGQHAAIEITEDQEAREPGMAPVWRTRLALSLPGLGGIEARLALSGNRLQLHIDTEDPASGPWLREALPVLVAALSARALDVAPVVIRDESGR